MTQKWRAAHSLLFLTRFLGITEAFKADTFKEKINLGMLEGYNLN